MDSERIPLISCESAQSGLSVFFATLCIIDIFGVFPIIALPRAIVQCGLLGIPLVIVVILLQIYTAVLLGKSWTIANSLDPQISKKNRYPLAAVTEFTLGPKIQSCVTVLLDLTVFGCGIPNLLVASQNLQLFGLKVSDNQFDMSFCYWLLVVGIGLCPLMWLGSPRDMKSLAIISTIAVIATGILVWWCIILDDRQLDTLPVPTSPSWDKFISGYGMLAFQFDVHPTLMTVQVDMRRPKDINKAVIASFLFTGIIFGVTSSLAVWKYGGSTTANILQIAPASYASRAAILISALQLIFSSVIGHSALFLHLEDEFHIQTSFGWKRCAMRSAIVLVGIVVGESVPRFDIVMALIGGTLTGPLVFVLPPIMYAKAKALKAQAEKRQFIQDVQSSAVVVVDDDAAADECHSLEDNNFINENYDNNTIHLQALNYGSKDHCNTKNSKFVYYNNKKKQKNIDSSCIALVETEPQNNFNITTNLFRNKLFRPIVIVKEVISNINLQQLVDWFGYLIVFLGIMITLSSTYINIKNTIRFVKFTPPCIVDASAHF